MEKDVAIPHLRLAHRHLDGFGLGFHDAVLRQHQPRAAAKERAVGSDKAQTVGACLQHNKVPRQMGINIRHLIRNQGGDLLNHESIPLRLRMHLAESRFPGSPSAVGYPQPNEQTSITNPVRVMLIITSNSVKPRQSGDRETK